jgi:hypothetical protein
MSEKELQDLKECSVCGLHKPIEAFQKKCGTIRRAIRVMHRCRSCYSAYQHNRLATKKKDAIKYKGGKCEKCGIQHAGNNAAIFDFHHKDPAMKDADWGKWRAWNKERLLGELDKCMLLCANCHRMEHFSGHTSQEKTWPGIKLEKSKNVPNEPHELIAKGRTGGHQLLIFSVGDPSITRLKKKIEITF